MNLLTPQVIITQLVLIGLLWLASRFGKKPLIVATIVFLVVSLMYWTDPARFVFQITVILATGAVQYHRIREREGREILSAFRNIFDRLTGK